MQRNNPLASLDLAPHNGDLSFTFLQSLAERQTRDLQGRYLAEGFRALHAAIAQQAPITGLAICRELLHSTEARYAIQNLRSQGIKTLNLTRTQFEQLARAPEPQGVILVLKQQWQPLPSTVKRKDLWLGVEHIRTPGNLGTLLRSAHAAGANGLIIIGPPRDRTDPYDPVVVRASMGSIFALDIISTTHQAIRRWPCRYETRILGADGAADTDYRKLDYRKPTILMLGEERQGLSEAQRTTCDTFARIPMAKGVDSLNLAMAGTLLLYEAVRSR